MPKWTGNTTGYLSIDRSDRKSSQRISFFFSNVSAQLLLLLLLPQGLVTSIQLRTASAAQTPQTPPPSTKPLHDPLSEYPISPIELHFSSQATHFNPHLFFPSSFFPPSSFSIYDDNNDDDDNDDEQLTIRPDDEQLTIRPDDFFFEYGRKQNTHTTACKGD
jgi:hypothetical protein